MNAAHTYQDSNVNISGFKGKKRIFTMAFGLGFTALLLAAGTTHASRNTVAAVSMQPADVKETMAASTGNCLSEQVERVIIHTGRRGTRVYSRSVKS